MLLPVDESIQLRLAHQVSARLREQTPQRPLIANARRNSKVTRPLHIGYVSADFRPHPMASLMGDIYKRHDRQRFYITAYSLGVPDESAGLQQYYRWRGCFREAHAIPDYALAMHR